MRRLSRYFKARFICERQNSPTPQHRRMAIGILNCTVVGFANGIPGTGFAYNLEACPPCIIDLIPATRYRRVLSLNSLDSHEPATISRLRVPSSRPERTRKRKNLARRIELVLSRTTQNKWYRGPPTFPSAFNELFPLSFRSTPLRALMIFRDPHARYGIDNPLRRAWRMSYPSTIVFFEFSKR